MKRHEFRLFADYRQFYLQDEEADGDLSESWTEEATGRLLALAPGTIGVGTMEAVEVEVAVEVRETEPPVRLAEWDHVVECGIDVPTGQVVVAGCTDYFPEAARVTVEPGRYRARVCGSGFDAVEAGGDSYLVQLWPGGGAEVRVLKRFAGASGV